MSMRKFKLNEIFVMDPPNLALIGLDNTLEIFIRDTMGIVFGEYRFMDFTCIGLWDAPNNAKAFVEMKLSNYFNDRTNYLRNYNSFGQLDIINGESISHRNNGTADMNTQTNTKSMGITEDAPQSAGMITVDNVKEYNFDIDSPNSRNANKLDGNITTGKEYEDIGTRTKSDTWSNIEKIKFEEMSKNIHRMCEEALFSITEEYTSVY